MMSHMNYENPFSQGRECDLAGAVAGVPDRLAASRIGEPFGDRVLRVGGAPTSSSRQKGTGEGNLSAQLISLETKVDRLHSVLIERDAAAPQADGSTRGDIESIRDSIQFVEAFVSITLVGKLDEMIGEKLQVVRRIEDERRRGRSWLITSIVCNVSLVAAIIVEAQAGGLLPVLSSAALYAQTFMVEIVHATSLGGTIAYDYATRLISAPSL